MKKVIFLVIFIVSITWVEAQDFPRKQFNLSTWANNVIDTNDDYLNSAELYEQYLQYLAQPIDLNEITEEQLQSLSILTVTQIQNFITYRKQAGKLLSVYELQCIAGFTKEVFLKLIPFVIVPEEKSILSENLFKKILAEKNNYLILRYTQTIESQKGFLRSTDTSSRYNGNPGDIYTRFRTSKTGDFSVGVTIKKDSGEPIQWNTAKKYYGVGYLSFHLQLQNKKRIKNLIIGDFQSQFGQGISLGFLFGIGKNAEAVASMRRSNIGFTPYTSQYEAGCFRGIAGTYQLSKNIFIHTLFSSRGRDGALSTDPLQNKVSSLNFTGLHRTSTELKNRNTFLETNAALIINYQKQSFDAGVILHHTQFDKPIQRNKSFYNYYSFNGAENTNVGTFLNYSLRNISFYSEFSQTAFHGNAVVLGLLASVTPQLDLSLSYRNFSPNYYSFYSNAISENTTPQNETGYYWGWKYSFQKKYSVSGYVDFFLFPWLKYGSYSPSSGTEWFVRFNYKPSKSITLFAQLREETKHQNSTDLSAVYFTLPGTRKNYCINIDYDATSYLHVKSRVQFNSYHLGNKTTNGLALIQDISIDWNKLSFSSRYALFDTDDYENRIYTYEHDVWLAFTFPAYNGKGIRTFTLIEYRHSPHLRFWVRWSQTHYTDRNSIGSGGEQILGNTQNDLRFQACFRF